MLKSNEYLLITEESKPYIMEVRSKQLRFTGGLNTTCKVMYLCEGEIAYGDINPEIHTTEISLDEFIQRYNLKPRIITCEIW
jgi:hypothetical protein